MTLHPVHIRCVLRYLFRPEHAHPPLWAEVKLTLMTGIILRSYCLNAIYRTGTSSSPLLFFFRFDTVMFVHPGVLCFVATHLEICHFAVGTSGVCRLTFIEQKHTFKWFNLYVMRLRTFCPTSWYYLYVPDITWCIPGSVRCGRHLTLPHKVFPGLPFSHIGTHIC